MDGGYDEYPGQAGQRPGYPARPNGQRQGPARRGPRPAQPGQGYPGQGYPGQGTSPQGMPPRGAPQRGTVPRGTPQPWQTGPQPSGGPRDQRQRDARDQGGRYPSAGPARGYDAGPGSRNEGFLPGWEDDDQGGHDDGGFWDAGDRDGRRGRRKARGAQASTRDHDDYYDEDDDFGRPPRRRRRFRWMAPLIALIVIAGVLGVPGYFGYKFYMGKYHPADYSGSGYGSVLVRVPSGANPTSLAPDLQRLGVVASTRAFVNAAEAGNTTSTLEVGYFQLHMHMKASLAWAILINPKNMIQTLVTFPEGLRAANIITDLGQHTKIPLSDYQAAIKDTAALGLPSYANGKPEGYLFPSQYQILPHETALQVLQAMVARYNQEAQTLHLTTAATPMHLNLGQLMIVASLVQAEGGRVSDYPKIARVVYNRLQLHMKLQFDSTVFYGLNKTGTAATLAEISTNTPWNTYKIAGLPPTPIDNPGVAAIEAALHPTTGTVASKWLYFLSFKNGTTEFSATPIKG